MKIQNSLLIVFLSIFLFGCNEETSTNNQTTSGTGNTNESSATIPASISGQYTFTFTESQTGSGIADGTVTVFNIGNDGTLVIDGTKTLTNPVLYKNNPYEAIWTDTSAQLKYAASSIIDGETLREINISNNTYYDDTANFKFYGQYKDSSANPAQCVTGYGTVNITPEAQLTETETKGFTSFCPTETPSITANDSDTLAVQYTGTESSLTIYDRYYINFADVTLHIGYYRWKLEGSGNLSDLPGVTLDKNAKTVKFENAVLVPKKVTFNGTTYQASGSLTLNGTLAYAL
ncbi:hypothetical protein [Thiomicrorhabdus sp.]|uniref:hypothetical protein n=1 Tax=Thiomicrorhabdus sp. TaxID=2039724 RepID=UPI0029C7E374|nr:hypothetical protein [Thiomicrorhabdus sp.]